MHKFSSNYLFFQFKYQLTLIGNFFLIETDKALPIPEIAHVLK